MNGQTGHRSNGTTRSSIHRNLYTYKGLRATGVIRILRLEPGTRDDPLRGELYSAELCDARGLSPNYEALSYVWGNADYKYILQTPDGAIRISTNLARALQRIRLPDQRRDLWADAVCINQIDRAERGHQVKMMGQVYSTARRVLVWLGPDPERKAGRIFAMASNPSQTSTENGLRTMKNALTELLRCEWFSRLWVVQEYHLARSAICMWGNADINFDYLHNALKATLMADDDYPPWVLLHSGRFNKRFTVSNALTSTRGLRCQNERDRVYAILGLPYDEKLRQDLVARIRRIEPDYALSVGQTMMKYARAFVDCSCTYLLLGQVCHGSVIKSHVHGPSWIPDLSAPETGQFLPFQDTAIKKRLSGDLARSISDRLDDDTRSLYLTGWAKTGTIRTIGPPMDPEAPGSRLEDIAAFWRWNVYPCRNSMDPSQYRLYERLFSQVLVCHNWDVMQSIHWNSLHAAITASTTEPTSKTTAKHTAQMLNSLEKSVTSRIDYDDITFFSPPRSYWKQRRLVKSAEGFIGMAPLATAKDDIVACFPQFHLPLVLRPKSNHYQFVGTMFMPGFARTRTEDEGYKTFEIQ